VDISNLLSDTEELLWNARDTLFTLTTPRYLAATGRLSGILRFGDIRVERLDSGRIGTISWLSLDTAELPRARWSLLTLSRRACNDSAVWEGSSSIWQNWGKAPVMLEGMRIRLSWLSNADTIRLYGLDSTGRLASGPFEPVRLSGGRVSITLDQTHPLQRTPWFILFQSWKTPQDTTDIAEPHPDAGSPHLSIPSPQPAHDQVWLEFWLPPTGAHARLELVTPLGQRLSLWQGFSDGSWHQLSVSVSRWAAGVYRVRLLCGDTQLSRSLVVLR
jgi:hypothetical protein